MPAPALGQPNIFAPEVNAFKRITLRSEIFMGVFRGQPQMPIVRATRSLRQISLDRANNSRGR